MSLQNAVDFFYAWVDGGPALKKLQNSTEWATYCVEFVTLALNVGLNVPLTEEYFNRIWPNGAGKKLWQRLQERLPELDYGTNVSEKSKDPTWSELRENFTKEAQSAAASQMPQGSFTPLWELEGISSPRSLVKDVSSTTVGAGFAWPLETTADLVAGFVETYANWPDFSPVFGTGALLSFASHAEDRIGVPEEKYVSLVMPAILAMYKHFATMTGMTRESWTPAINEMMRQLNMSGVPTAVTSLLQSQLLSAEYTNATFALPPASPQQAWKNYVTEIRATLQEARKFNPPITLSQIKKYRQQRWEDLKNAKEAAQNRGDAKSASEIGLAIKFYSNDPIRYNAAPHLALRVAQGARPASKFVDVQALGTLFPADILKKLPKNQTSVVYDMKDIFKSHPELLQLKDE